ncbi:M48 family metallopeptidase [Novosphingobium bradum]|uniref:M48 family metallopeptidase n=1 Tax=Novosphingobium bradum TaxID=1737444 RepID=A0ABV7IQ89_9SPHN
MSLLPDFLRRSPGKRDAAPTLTLGTRTLPIEIRRLATARRLTLRLAPDGSAIRITIPNWAPTREALAFVHSRTDWLESQLGNLPASQPLAPGGKLPWRGTPHLLVHRADLSRGVRLVAQTVEVGGPAESLNPRLRRWIQAEARALFEADLAHYAPRAGVAVPALALTNARRRWGSCSAEGTVRMNWRLAMAPDPVRRSVVAHEVTHLVHFDHSSRFHALLADLFEDDIATANRWLKHHGRTLYAPLG